MHPSTFSLLESRSTLENRYHNSCSNSSESVIAYFIKRIDSLDMLMQKQNCKQAGNVFAA